MAFASCYTRIDNEQFRREGIQYVPCYKVDEVEDSRLLELGLSIEDAGSKVMLDAARGKKSAAKEWANSGRTPPLEMS